MSSIKSIFWGKLLVFLLAVRASVRVWSWFNAVHQTGTLAEPRTEPIPTRPEAEVRVNRIWG